MSPWSAKNDLKEALSTAGVNGREVELEEGQKIREELIRKFTREGDRIFYTFEDFRSSVRSLYIKGSDEILEDFLWDDSAYIFFDESVSESVFELESAKDFMLLIDHLYLGSYHVYFSDQTLSTIACLNTYGSLFVDGSMLSRFEAVFQKYVVEKRSTKNKDSEDNASEDDVKDALESLHEKLRLKKIDLS